MQLNSLPTSFGQWKRYFDVTFTYVSQIIPKISFGNYKIDLILTNLNMFRMNFMSTHPQSVSAMESRVLFDFFKTCAAFISFCSQYVPNQMMDYILKHPVNEQYNELAILWTSWSVHSSSLAIDSFMDINELSFAHSLDMKCILDAFYPIVNRLPIPVGNSMKLKLDNMILILRRSKPQNSEKHNGIISHNQYSTIKQIGLGAYATVTLAKFIPTGEEIAIKELKNVQLSNRNIVSLKRELNALLQLKHPNIVDFLGVTVTPPFCIATKYIPNGSLFDSLHGKNPVHLSPTDRLKIALGMARGLEYLEAMRYIHRDFKSQNVLLDKDNNPIICDFGLSRQLGINMTSELGTIQWAAPEILVKFNETMDVKNNNQNDDSQQDNNDNNSSPKNTNKNTQNNNKNDQNENNNSGLLLYSNNYDSAVDIYSYGLVLYELITNNVPYRGLFQLQIAALVSLKNYRPDLPEDVRPELAKLVRQCWDGNPGKRPKAITIRRFLESGLCSFDGADMAVFMAFVNSTKQIHEEIVKMARERADRERQELILRIHTVNPLDPIALSSLQQLCSSDYTLSVQLFEDVLRLTNQSLSIEVQDEAFNVLRQMLAKDDFVEFVEISKAVDEVITMIETQPMFALTAVKLLAPKIKNVPEMIAKFLDMPQHSHLILEMIQALISANKKKLTPLDIVNVFNSLTGRYAVGFFRFMLGIFGPLPEFLPLAVRNLFILSLYFKELAIMCDDDLGRVQNVIINIDEAKNEGKETLQHLLESISILLVNPENGEINEKMAVIIYKFIVENCFMFSATDSILPLLNICAREPSMKSIISNSDYWKIIIGTLNDANISYSQQQQQYIQQQQQQQQYIQQFVLQLNQDQQNQVNEALLLIERIPIVPDLTLAGILFNTLVEIYMRTRDFDVAHTLCSLLKRRGDFDLNQLLPFVICGISSDDTSYCVTSLKIARRVRSEVYPMLDTESFWASLKAQIERRNDMVCQSIGKLTSKMVENMSDFTFDPIYLGAVISLLYDPATSFDTAMPFIAFLGTSCRVKQVVVFLYKRFFIQYLEQLPWRYENESRVAETIAFCASVLSKSYLSSA